ncbi:MAG TPA: ABC transporter substrate-binding protein [Pilimelia sp.]|nr:ABC transporter substrate-binding protein [Pilimelia sp.]
MPSIPPTTRAAAALLTIAVVLSGCSPVDSGTSTPAADDNRPAKQGGTLRVALANEPDKLDPTLARTLVGRTVFNAICEKLYDIDRKLAVVPQLAAALPELSADGKTATVKLRTGLKFADGTSLDATAVKTSLDRHITLAGSARRSELSSVDSVVVVDPATVTIKLKTPFAPLPAVLADRAGMVMSPAALAAHGANFGTNPVCVGPFKFASRVAQDRIEVVKDPNYYDAAKVHLDKVIYRIIADATTRFNNLRSGDVEVLDAVAATDVDALKADPNLRLLTTNSIGYQGITVNLGNVNGVGKPAATLAAPYAGPLATDARVRRALSLSLDRAAINRVVFRGQFTPACGPISPESPFSSEPAQACAQHDPAAAKQLLASAGVATPLKATMIIGNTPEQRRLGEAIQAQAKAGGFDIQLAPTEFSASLDQTDAGKYQLFQIGWSGRVDPDGNITNFVRSLGSQNVCGYGDPAMDSLIDKARESSDVETRRNLYGQIVTKLQEDAPLIYLYRTKNFTGVTSKVVGVRMYGDGIPRFGTAGFAA